MTKIWNQSLMIHVTIFVNNFKPVIIFEPGWGGGKASMQTSQGLSYRPCWRGGRAWRHSKPPKRRVEGAGWDGEEGGWWWSGGDGGKEEEWGENAAQPGGGQIPLGPFCHLSPTPTAPAQRFFFHQQEVKQPHCSDTQKTQQMHQITWHSCLPEQCNHCDQNLSRKSSLSKHMLVVHGGLSARVW